MTDTLISDHFSNFLDRDIGVGGKDALAVGNTHLSEIINEFAADTFVKNFTEIVWGYPIMV